MESLQKIKNRTTIWSRNTTSGHLSEWNKNTDVCTLIFIAALFKVAKTQKQTKCPLMDELIKKMCVCVCITEYFSAIKSKRNFPFVIMWIGPWAHYTNWNKSDRERQIR